jgi:hypothetical protein
MKKLFLLSLLAVIGLTYTAQSSTVTETVKAVSDVADTVKTAVTDGVAFVDTSGLYRQIYTDVKSGLSGLADGLKVGVEHVYAVLVKQQVVKSITNIIVLFTFVFLAFLFANKVYPWATENEKSSDGFSLVIYGFGIFLILIPAMIEIGTLEKTVTGFINPEYGAIMQIMEWATNAVK